MFLPDDSELADARKHLEMSEEELYEELAKTDSEFAFGEDALDWGKRHFQNLNSNLRGKICREPSIKDIFARGAGNRRLLMVCAIADVIHTAGALSAAALIVKEGLETYCKKLWGPEGG